MLQKKILEDIDAEELAGIDQEEHTYDKEAEQRQHDCARTNPHSPSMSQDQRSVYWMRQKEIHTAVMEATR